jgi:hypothetical protein
VPYQVLNILTKLLNKGLGAGLKPFFLVPQIAWFFNSVINIIVGALVYIPEVGIIQVFTLYKLFY